MDNGDQYFGKKIIVMSKYLHNARCQILKDEWQLMTLAWHRGCNYNGVA
jgi:hypothetical protein